MQQRIDGDGQGQDDWQRGQGKHAQYDVHLALIGCQGVEDVKLVRACAGQLHLRTDEDPR